MPATRKGVYHNLKESKYTVSNSEIVFFFSSRVYLNKFMNGYAENRKKACNKLVKQTPLNMDTLADIQFYLDIEKRGFYVWLHGVSINENDLQNYAMRRMTEHETLDWKELERIGLSKRFRQAVRNG